MPVNGKLIYQLTSAEALKDTDLFVISSTDNLTRSITLSQLRQAVNNNTYTKSQITDLLDEFKSGIKKLTETDKEFQNYITEFRNDFNTQLQQLRLDTASDINGIKSKFNDTLSEFQSSVNNQIDELYDLLSNLSKSTGNRFTQASSENKLLSDRINDINTDLTNKINGLISYGTEIPTSLDTGKVYLQYF